MAQCGNPDTPAVVAIEVCSGLISLGQYQAEDLEYLLIGRGNARMRGGDMTGAIIDYDLAQNIVFNSVGARYNRALARIELDQYEAALADLDEVVAMSPTWAQGHGARGTALSGLDDDVAAIEAYSHALELAPTDAEVWTDRGVSYLILGDLDRGIVDLNEAIRLNPRAARAYIMRGLARQEQGNPSSALRDFDAALAIWPDNTAVQGYRQQVLQGGQ